MAFLGNTSFRAMVKKQDCFLQSCMEKSYFAGARMRSQRCGRLPHDEKCNLFSQSVSGPVRHRHPFEIPDFCFLPCPDPWHLIHRSGTWTDLLRARISRPVWQLRHQAMTDRSSPWPGPYAADAFTVFSNRLISACTICIWETVSRFSSANRLKFP